MSQIKLVSANKLPASGNLYTAYLSGELISKAPKGFVEALKLFGIPEIGITNAFDAVLGKGSQIVGLHIDEIRLTTDTII